MPLSDTTDNVKYLNLQHGATYVTKTKYSDIQSIVASNCKYLPSGQLQITSYKVHVTSWLVMYFVT